MLESWDIDILSDPCGSANCSNSRGARDCNWAGIACRNWDIVALAMPCTILSDGSHTGCALIGSPLDILTQVGPVNLLLEVCFAWSADMTTISPSGHLHPLSFCKQSPPHACRACLHQAVIKYLACFAQAPIYAVLKNCV